MAKVPQELLAFVDDALRRGVSRDDIAKALRNAGWSDERVAGALDAYADVDFPVPVPRPRPESSARDAFLYLLLFTTLGITAFNLGSLMFSLIDRAVPDPLDPGYRSGDSRIRWAVASLLVAGPAYAWLSSLVRRRLARDPVRRRSPVRRWLTYIALFIAAGTLIGDLIALVNGLLEGDLSARFLLKSLTVAVIAGTVFGVYLWDLRRDGDDE